MTVLGRYDATFAEFATANCLDYDWISTGTDLYIDEFFKDYVQHYKLARLGIVRRLGETPELRHHPTIINKIARVPILPKSGDKDRIKDKF
jgi:hypothetical protein